MSQVVFLMIVALLVAAGLARPQEPTPHAGAVQGSTPIPIVSQSSETKEDGSFSYGFETGNGIKVEESGTIKQGPPSLQGRSAEGGEDEDGNNTILALQGSFSFTAPDGQLYSVKYIADENGFQPEGAHLPTPPPGLEGSAIHQAASPQRQGAQPAGLEGSANHQVQNQVQAQVEHQVLGQQQQLAQTTETTTTV